MDGNAVYRRNLKVYYAFGFSMDFMIWAGVWIKYLIDVRGLELKWILAMDLPFWLVSAALQAPMGALADHVGKRKVLIASAFCWTVVILGFGFTTNYWMLFADYLLWGLAIALRSGTDSALLFDTLKQAGREDEYQKIAGRGFAVRLSAGVAGLVLGGQIANQIGLAATVQLSCLATFVAAGIAWFFIEPTVQRESEHYLVNLKAGLTYAWKHAEVRYTILIGSVILTGTFGPVVLMQPFLLDHNVATGLYGIVQAPIRMVSLVAALLAFWVSRRTQTGRLFLAACVVITACYVGLAAWSATIAFAFFALPALVSGLTDPVVGAHLNARIPSDRRATVLSVMPLLFALQVAFFEPALGFFADGVSLRSAFIFAAGYFVVLMPPLMFLWWRAHATAPPADLESGSLELAAGG